MKVENVKKVGVVGCGTMGPSIAATMLTKYPIVVREVNDKLAKEGLEKIKACIPSLVRRNILTQVQAEMCYDRITMTTGYAAFKDCQLVIDATPDIMDIKVGVLQELDKVCPPDTTFTHTSAVALTTALAAKSGRPDRYIGGHYNIPAHLVPLVEVAPAIQTSKETLEFYLAFLKDLGKTTVMCKDRPGMIVDYLLFYQFIEACRMVEQGVATAEEIDTCLRLGLGHPMPLFELMDSSGLDNGLVSIGFLKEQLADPRFELPLLYKKLCEAGYLGKKTGKGFYEWDASGKKIGPTKLP